MDPGAAGDVCSGSQTVSRGSAVGGFATRKRSPSATRHIERRDASYSGGSRSLKPDPGWTSSSRSNPTRGGGRTGW